MRHELVNHPIADAFPMMDEQSFAELIADIRRHGRIINPIVLVEGMVLDGRNRARAAAEAGVELTEADFTTLPDGIDPIDFVVSLNLHRRHLSQTQREAAAAELANLKQGGTGANQYQSADPPNGDSAPGEPDAPKSGISQAEAAVKLNVSERGVQRATAVKKGDPESFADMKADKITTGAAERAMKAKQAAKRAASPPKGKPVPQASTKTATEKHARDNLAMQRKWNELFAVYEEAHPAARAALRERILADAFEPSQRPADAPAAPADAPAEWPDIKRAWKALNALVYRARDLKINQFKRDLLNAIGDDFAVTWKPAKPGGQADANLRERLLSIFEKLKKQGSTNAATVNIPLIQEQAYTLKQIIDAWPQGTAAPELEIRAADLDRRAQALDKREQILNRREHGTHGVLSERQFRWLRNGVHPDKTNEFKPEYNELHQVIGMLEPLFVRTKEEEAAIQRQKEFAEIWRKAALNRRMEENKRQEAERAKREKAMADREVRKAAKAAKAAEAPDPDKPNPEATIARPASM